eukprot:CAMPEP_0204537964 /NCGR_PEP_ID=MMETSP0661-20131031/15647_1 /ASSEMBLY_ACC=CAM_ASM_000606 /TAXON_ID=109239 /ORGANISM="Alexandrium margalefi, Strain AMGDE01CS-322" /LENGTH=107 /DNA_ID=CAMNT_0051544543 /DNA_START=26 /DNA_END=346 /DNA_ORIENTATION=+
MSGLPVEEEDNKLLNLASGVKQRGRTMMHLYDLTSKFDGTTRVSVHQVNPGTSLYSVVHSKAFITLSSLLIFINAVLIGVQMNTEVVNAISGQDSSGARPAWRAVEI